MNTQIMLPVAVDNVAIREGVSQILGIVMEFVALNFMIIVIQ